MGNIYLLQGGQRNKEIKHTRTPSVKDKMVNEGWKHIATVNGWNIGIHYKE